MFIVTFYYFTFRYVKVRQCMNVAWMKMAFLPSPYTFFVHFKPSLSNVHQTILLVFQLQMLTKWDNNIVIILELIFPPLISKYIVPTPKCYDDRILIYQQRSKNWLRKCKPFERFHKIFFFEKYTKRKNSFFLELTAKQLLPAVKPIHKGIVQYQTRYVVSSIIY